jgi:hypothetical protein
VAHKRPSASSDSPVLVCLEGARPDSDGMLLTRAEARALRLELEAAGVGLGAAVSATSGTTSAVSSVTPSAGAVCGSASLREGTR